MGHGFSYFLEVGPAGGGVRQGVAVVVLEAAILIEANWTPLVDEVWVTTAPESAVLERLKKQRGLAKEQTLARIRSQLSNEERLKHADVVINNEGKLGEVKARVKELWAKIHVPDKKKVK